MKRNLNRLRGVVVAVVATTLALAGCSSSGDSDGSGGSGGGSGDATQLIMTYPGAFSFNFHPAADVDSGQQVYYNLLYSNLVRRGAETGSVVPDLATSWEAAPDTASFTFTLNPDAKWSDGEPVTAEDVVFTATIAAQHPELYTGYGATAWTEIDGAGDIAGTSEPLSGIQAVDEHTVQIDLAAPDSQYLITLANAVHVILPEHVLESVDPATWATSAFATETPVGSGPYSLEKVEPDQYLEFKANPDYYAGAPKIAKIFVKTGLTDSTIVDQLKTGELDVALGMDPSAQPLLASTSRLATSVDVGVGTMYVQYRVDNPRVSDPRVRQAFYYGIDRASMLKNLFGDAGKVIWAPAGFDQTAPDLEHYDYDPDKAKSLLEEAGFDFSEPLPLPYSSEEPGWDKIAAVIKDDLAKLDVEVTLQPMDTTAWAEKLGDPDPEAFGMTLNCCGTEGRSPDASSIYYAKTFIGTKYWNDELISLFDQGKAEADPAKQAEIYDEAARILNADVPYNWLWLRSGLNVLPTNLKGATIYQSVIDTTSNVWEWSLE